MSPEKPKIPEIETWPSDGMLKIESDVSKIDAVEIAAKKYLEKSGFTEDDQERFGLALREAVINAVTHGNQSNPAKEVTISLVFNGKENKMTARVTDQGAGFDAATIPDPLDEGNLMATHGRGILMIKALCKDTDFLDGGRTIVFSMEKE